MRMDSRRPKVLLVDDNQELLESVARTLQKRGLEVLTSPSALGVSSLIRRHEPQVVVLDVMMPALGGGALAKLIKSGTREAPAIVFFSAMPEEELRSLARSIDGATYVPKTDGVDALYEAICRVAPARSA
jgi:DNA-binding response OmpR family regulator